MENASILQLIFIIVTAMIGLVAVASGLTGFFQTKMNPIERILFVGAGIMMVTTSVSINAVAAVILGVVAFWQFKKKKSSPALAVQ